MLSMGKNAEYFYLHSSTGSRYGANMNSAGNRSDRVRRNTARFLGTGILISAAMLMLSSLAVSKAARGRLYDSAADIPKRKVGLLLGCAKTLRDGRENLFYTYRVNAAAELYRSGKVDYLLVSGDNHIASYDESSEMKDSLIQRGVPADAIYCDYAGFRTFDSVVRAKRVFGQSRVTVISQRFHNQRAIFIARANGLDAIGFNAQSVDRFNAFRTKVREQLAKVKALLDVAVLLTEPHFLGDPIVIGKEGRTDECAPHSFTP